MKKSILFFIAMTFVLFSFAQEGASYALDAFDKVENSIIADVVLIPGSEHSIRIIATTDNLKEISMEVKSGTLKIQAKRNNAKWNKKQKIKIFVTFKELSRITLNGVGDMLCKAGITAGSLDVILNGVGDFNLYKLDVGSLNIQLNGSGNIELYGNSKQAAYNINGAGNINAFHLTSADVSANVNGAGNLDLSVSHKLDASIEGVGNIKYKGSPSDVNVKSTGVGRIAKE